MAKKIALLLRGHIRNGFADDNLYNYIKTLLQIYDVDIYIHTWNESEAKRSWRELNRKNIIQVTETYIQKYFRDISVHIQSIKNENDDDIQLIGSLNGVIASSKLPKLYWKRMWYGKYSLINTVKSTNKLYDAIINTRFDFFKIKENFGTEEIKQKIYTCEKKIYSSIQNFIVNKKKGILFLADEPCVGIDNYYVGDTESIYKLTEEFHNHLDQILVFHKRVIHQEHIVFLEVQESINYNYNIIVYSNHGQFDISLFRNRKLYVYSTKPDSRVFASFQKVTFESFAWSYLNYIVSNYSNLPEYIAFTNTDSPQYSQHSILYFLDVINKKPITGNHQVAIKFKDKHRKYSIQDVHFEKWFCKYIQPTFKVDDTKFIYFVGSQFVVNRSAILSREKTYYDSLLNLFESQNINKLTQYLEYSWYYLFQPSITWESEPSTHSLQQTELSPPLSLEEQSSPS